MFLITLFESKKTREEKQHLNNLVALAKQDGEIDQHEMAYLWKIAKKNGFEHDEFLDLLEEVSSEEFHAPKNDAERFEQLFELVELMRADGSIHEKELDFCIEVANKFGFRKAIAGVAVRKLAVDLDNGLDKEAIRQDFQNFLSL